MVKTLLIIDSDPRQGGRAAEAVRVAAGTGVWRKVDLAVYLREAAVLILGEDADELVDGENYARYLPLLSGRPVYVQQGAPLLEQIRPGALPFETISDGQLAAIAARCDCVMRF